LLVAAFLQAAFNFYAPLTQIFPNEFKQLALHARSQHAGNPKTGEYRLLRIQPESLYPVPKRIDLPKHSVVLERPHPKVYLPYQYEEYTPAQRKKVRSTDISMRLVYVPNSNDTPRTKHNRARRADERGETP
jgi:hypothetical protein